LRKKRIGIRKSIEVHGRDETIFKEIETAIGYKKK